MNFNLLSFLIGFATCLFIVVLINQFILGFNIANKLKNKPRNKEYDSDMR